MFFLLVIILFAVQLVATLGDLSPCPPKELVYPCRCTLGTGNDKWAIFECNRMDANAVKTIFLNMAENIPVNKRDFAVFHLNDTQSTVS